MHYFFVFQNKTFKKELDGGYLWAPDGKCSHWQLMHNICKGDVIFHSYHQKIVAISRAKTDCYCSIQPKELAIEKLWESDGLRVDCEYCILPSALETKTIMDELLILQSEKYAPFNIRGRGNTGYLFDCSFPMAHFLFRQLKKNVRNLSLLQEFEQ